MIEWVREGFLPHLCPEGKKTYLEDINGQQIS